MDLLTIQNTSVINTPDPIAPIISPNVVTQGTTASALSPLAAAAAAANAVSISYPVISVRNADGGGGKGLILLALAAAAAWWFCKRKG